MDFQDVALARLTSAQRAAWRHVGETESVVGKRTPRSRGEHSSELRVYSRNVRRGDRERPPSRAVVLHFHPARIGVKPITIAEALLEEGLYRNQFETGLSSGSLSAFPGGARDAWEGTLFGGAYHGPDSSIGDRPKYGALETVIVESDKR